MADVALRAGELEERREAEAELVASLEGEPIAEPLALDEPEDKPFSSLVPAIIGAANLMQTLSATVIANALPAMAITLRQSPVSLNTTITIYLLALAVFLPVSGWAADRFGAKRVFLIAIGLYAASCAACGFANNLPELLIARFAEGAAGALMGPVGRLVLLRTTPKHDLVRAMSVLTMPSLLGPVIGPPIGGFIVTYISWRWIFFLNLPIAVMGLILVTRYIKDIKEEDAGPLDWMGMVLTGLGLAAVVFGFENLGRNNLPAFVPYALLGVGLALLGVYAAYARRTPHAILDLKLFRIPTFFASIVGGTFMRMGVGATPFLLALLLQVAFGLSPFQAGMMTFASAAAALVMKTSAPPILARFGFKRTLSVNAVIVGLSFMAYAVLTRQTPHWIIYAILLTGGFFRSLQFTALNGLGFADIDQPQMSRASTMSAMGQRLAQSIGIGFAATLLRLFQGQQHARHVTVETIAPAFLIIGAVALISAGFFVALPSDAGEALHGGPRRVRA
ncbi:MAG TPA: MFS transporter [Caulobacteraceae bacterium]|nr:MFS transporter [Caulobacteraceae bacterium]